MWTFSVQRSEKYEFKRFISKSSKITKKILQISKKPKNVTKLKILTTKNSMKY